MAVDDTIACQRIKIMELLQVFKLNKVRNYVSVEQPNHDC
jgi:hypothetical protein